jgi:hypothetical protein
MDQQYFVYIFVSVGFVVCMVCLFGDACDAALRNDDITRNDNIVIDNDKANDTDIETIMKKL